MNRIGVVGFGKIGQALAAFIIKAGISVVTIDINPEISHAFNQDRFSSNEPGVQDLLINAYKQNQLEVNSTYSALKGLDAVIITMPLLVDNEKKILEEQFLQCFKQLAPYCNNNTLIIVETSMPVGFARNKIIPAIETTGKQHGKDFLLVHSPERIKSGTMLQQLDSIPKIIGGITEQATDRAFDLYSAFFPAGLLKKVDSIEAAELVKLAGMIYRDVNIALSNQLAKFAGLSGIHFADLIQLINTDKEAGLLQPGIGVGGHCTPVYPYFLMENFKSAGIEFTLAKESRFINDSMARYSVDLISNRVTKKKALLLGLGFRPNVKEDAFSTTYLVNAALIAEGFEVLVHDTEYSFEDMNERGLKAAKDIYSSGAEVLFLITMHNEYRQLDFARLAESGIKFIVDGRNLLPREKIELAGIVYIGIGR